jgi:hypothetical protein
LAEWQACFRLSYLDCRTRSTAVATVVATGVFTEVAGTGVVSHAALAVVASGFGGVSTAAVRAWIAVGWATGTVLVLPLS